MSRVTTSMAVAACLALTACGGDNSPANGGAILTNPTPTPTASSGQFFGTDANVRPSQADAVLTYASHSRGFAELRLPNGAGPFPLAVIYHGGCWRTGTATQAYMQPLATRWQQQGIATLNVDYREVGDGGGWTGSFVDWQASAALIAQVAASYPIDRARVTLVGHSAGALPAQWLASAQDSQGPVGARGALDVRAVLVFDGPADVGLERAAFDNLCQFAAVDPFMGGSPSAVPTRYAAISPTGHPPLVDEVLFVQAVLPAPPGAAQQAIRAGGAELTIYENPGAGHFSVITPGSAVYNANEAVILDVLRGP